MRIILQKLMLLFTAVLPLTACASDNNSDIETGTNNSQNMTINITIDGQTLSASLVENSSTAALIERLQQGPVTYSADDYGGFEKVGNLGFSLPRNDRQVTTKPEMRISVRASRSTTAHSFTRLMM